MASVVRITSLSCEKWNGTWFRSRLDVEIDRRIAHCAVLDSEARTQKRLRVLISLDIPLLLSQNTVMLTAREPLSTRGSHDYPMDTSCPVRPTSKWDTSGQMSHFPIDIVPSRHWQTALTDIEFSTEAEFNTPTNIAESQSITLIDVLLNHETQSMEFRDQKPAECDQPSIVTPVGLGVLRCMSRCLHKAASPMMVSKKSDPVNRTRFIGMWNILYLQVLSVWSLAPMPVGSKWQGRLGDKGIYLTRSKRRIRLRYHCTGRSIVIYGNCSKLENLKGILQIQLQSTLLLWEHCWWIIGDEARGE